MSKQTARGLALAAAIAGSLAAMSAAAAGECPAGHMKANARTMVDYKPVGVTDTTLGAINLEQQPAHIVGRECASASSPSSPAGSCPGTAMTTAPR